MADNLTVLEVQRSLRSLERAIGESEQTPVRVRLELSSNGAWEVVYQWEVTLFPRIWYRCGVFGAWLNQDFAEVIETAIQERSESSR